MAKLISKNDSHHDYVWRCDCSDSHYVELSWDDEDPEWRYLSLASIWHTKSLAQRLKVAWRVLRGRDYCDGDVLLDEQNVNDLLEVLSKHSKA